MLKKKQVHSFLKILQISTDQSAEEIELALKEAGWNLKDAKEAVKVLYPEGDEDTQKNTAPVPKPQFVAQVTKPIGEARDPRPTPQARPTLAPEADARSPQVRPKEQRPVNAPSAPPPQGKALHVSIVPPLERPPAASPTAKASTVATGEPLTFTPDLIAHPEVATNVTVRPTTTDGMARQLFRSDDHRLSAETITNLLGIDVDVRPDEFEILKHRRQPNLTFPQLLIIVVSSIVLAFATLMYGMYLFQVGPFHPTVEAFSF